MLRAGALLLGTSLVAACSADPTTSTTTDQAAGGGRTAKIYVISPQSGPDAALGLGMRNSAQLAVEQAKARGDIPGWNLEVVPLDDAGDPAKAAEAAKKAASDEATVAVVGSIFSGLTKAMQQPLADAGILLVSPSATNPTLTRGEDYAKKPKRQYDSFFRVIAPDDAHAPALAQYLHAQNIGRVAVVHDGDSYGSGLAAAFTESFQKEGGKVVLTAQVDPKAPPVYTKVVQQLVAAKPQAVLFGGVETQGGALAGQIREAGLTVPVVGGDALATELYIPKSGPVSGGDLSTASGAPVDTVEAGKAYLAAYRDHRFRESATSYGPLGYDAATAAVAALKTALPSASSPEAARKAAVAAMPSVKIDGTSGPVAFDEFGDVTPRSVTVNVLRAGAWAPAKTYSFG